VVLGPRLIRRRHGHTMHEVGVPRGGHADGLGEDGGDAGAPDAMEALVPPVVFGDAEPLDGCGAVYHLGDLFFQRHASHEIARASLEGL